MIQSGHSQYVRRHVLGMKSSCTITRSQGSRCMLSLQQVRSSHFHCATSMLILAPACHPTLRTDWFLKLGENNHTRALTVFRHVYEEYASNMSQPEDQPAACDGFDSGSDNGILGSAAAHPVVEQTHPHTESQSEFARWVANEGGPGKMHHPLIWWKVRRHARLIRKLTYVRMAYQAHAKEFPVIAKMAQDFLAVMGTSVSVERLFSSSRHICRDTRSSLKADSVSSLLLAKKWLQDPTIFRKVFGVSM
jgi:hypothetical protein